jgi:AcrR family transcriptional regulator
MISSGLTREKAVVSYRREALLAAMMAESASFGFKETTVARVATRAGVSRSEFYRHFAGKEECFLATFDELLELTYSRVALAPGRPLAPRAGDDRRARARAGVAMLLELACLRPEAAKLCLVQARGAGPRAAARLDGAIELFEQALRYRQARGSSERAKNGGVSPTVVTGIVGGIYRVTYERLRTGRERELGDLADEIVEWMLLYDRPAGARARTPKRRSETERGEREGAGAQTVDAPSQPTRRALLAAYDRGIERLMLAAGESLGGAPDWPSGVRGALAAIAELLSDEPALLELAMVRIFTLGEAGRERDAHSLAAFAELLAPGEGLTDGGNVRSPLVSELIAGGIWEIFHRHAAQGRGHELRERAGALSYLALTPFIGREAAARPR